MSIEGGGDGDKGEGEDEEEEEEDEDKGLPLLAVVADDIETRFVNSGVVAIVVVPFMFIVTVAIACCWSYIIEVEVCGDCWNNWGRMVCFTSWLWGAGVIVPLVLELSLISYLFPLLLFALDCCDSFRGLPRFLGAISLHESAIPLLMQRLHGRSGPQSIWDWLQATQATAVVYVCNRFTPLPLLLLVVVILIPVVLLLGPPLVMPPLLVIVIIC